MNLRFLSTSRIGTKGTTMVELMAVLAIMGLSISALIAVLQSGVEFANDTENNIKAINIAREGMEGMINIRDTNWILFSSDRNNCWDTLGYSGTCIGGPSGAPKINSGSYTIFTKDADKRWYLSGSTGSYSSNWDTYLSNFRVGLSGSGYYTQTGVSTTQFCNNTNQISCYTQFAREIKIKKIGTGSMEVESIVRWKDKRDRSVILKTVLTNWKSKF